MDSQELAELKRENRVLRQMQAQSALHGDFGQVYVNNGGAEWLQAWSREYPSEFIKLFAKMTPGLMPQAGLQGDVNITINNNLGRTELDGEFEDVTDAD